MVTKDNSVVCARLMLLYNIKTAHFGINHSATKYAMGMYAPCVAAQCRLVFEHFCCKVEHHCVSGVTVHDDVASLMT